MSFYETVTEPVEVKDTGGIDITPYAAELDKIEVGFMRSFTVTTGKPSMRRIPVKDEHGKILKTTDAEGKEVTVFEKNEDGTDKQVPTGRGLDESRHARGFELAADEDKRKYVGKDGKEKIGISVKINPVHHRTGEKAGKTDLEVTVQELRETKPRGSLNRLRSMAERRKNDAGTRFAAASDPAEKAELQRKGKHHASVEKAANDALKQLDKGVTEEEALALVAKVRAMKLPPAA